MKVITANLNGIRSAYNKGFFDWLALQDADYVCVQETKIQTHQMTPDLLMPKGFTHQGFFNYAHKAGYSGVGVYSKTVPNECYIGFNNININNINNINNIDLFQTQTQTQIQTIENEFDTEGRLIRLEFDTLTLISAYFPSGSSGEERQAAKFRFLEAFLPYFKTVFAQSQLQGRSVLLCGDINIAHAEIDLKNWKANLKHSGFTLEERTWMTQFLNNHTSTMIDVWRYLYKTDSGYTWWSNRGAAYANNVGWRIDYQLASADLAQKAQAATVYKAQKFSDHAPLIVEYL